MRAVLIAGIIAAMAGVFPLEARARKVEDVFKGQIVVMTKRPPSRFSSQGGFVRFLRANRKKHVWPDKKNKKQWRFEFMAFFARPLNDLEAKVKFYDITEGKKFIAADTIYLPNRGERIFASDMLLTQPEFEVNRQYTMLLIATRSNTVIAKTSFWLRGEKERYSGKVTFTDDEAKLKK